MQHGTINVTIEQARNSVKGYLKFLAGTVSTNSTEFKMAQRMLVAFNMSPYDTAQIEITSPLVDHLLIVNK